MLEEVVQAGRFVFYRDSRDPRDFFYAPDEPRLAVGRDGRPEFLFIKYTRAGTESAPETRGGLVHFLVTWGFDEHGLRTAERALQRVEPGARLVGPLPFKEGTFAVVSASAGADGVFSRRIVGEGKAPVLPGNKAAVSMALTPEGATVLWEAFQRETSEVSVVFLLRFAGLTPAYEAKLRVDWDQVYTHHDVKVGVEGQYGVVQGKLGVRAIFDELRRQGAIELEVTGESESMGRVLDVAYEHILRQMFDPVMLPPDAASNPEPGPAATPRRSGDLRPVTGSAGRRWWRDRHRTSSFVLASFHPAPQDQGSPRGPQPPTAPEVATQLPLLDLLPLCDDERGGERRSDADADGETPPAREESPTTEGRGEPRRGEGSAAESGGAETPPALTVEIGYVFRRIRQTGRYEVDLRQRLREDRELTTAGNIGGFIAGRADQKRHLLEVNLDDPFFEDRTVEVLLDGQDYEDLRLYVNAVTVQLRRTHDGGTATEDDVRFTAEQFARQGNRQTWVYPRLGDRDWLPYEYRVTWQFHGGARWQSEWQRSSESVLVLTSPAEYRTLRLSLDQDDFLMNDLRAVAVQVRHHLFGLSRVHELLFDYAAGDPLQATYRYAREPGDDRYEIKTVWVGQDGGETAMPLVVRESSYVLLRFPD
jgi:hypothetical protein